MVIEPNKNEVEDRPQGELPRLAFTVYETAEILRIHRNSVYSLLSRGLLKSSSALRCKIIPRAEIERFLKSTLE
jgi:hypothetical protein